jgi:hypothetical protein
MCWTLFIATDTPKNIEKITSSGTKLYLHTPSEDDMELLIPLFTKPYIYGVGINGGCACGFDFNMPAPADFEWYEAEDYLQLAAEKQPPEALLQFLRDHTKNESIELFSKWEAWDNFSIKNNVVKNILDICLETNYFGMEDQQFILFEQQSR